MDMLKDGKFEHTDLAMYFLHCNSNLCHQRVFMKRKDASDCLERLKVIYPLSEENLIPPMTLDRVPDPIKSMMEGLYKIEWHYNGMVNMMMSDKYRSRFKFHQCKQRAVYRKCLDTMGFAKPEQAFKMWIESVYRPGGIIVYEGAAYDQDAMRKITQKVIMITVVYDYEHFITATQVF
jgi:hypothetical protein